MNPISESNGASNGRPRVVVLGIDAADVDLVERWMDEGRLPTLQSLRDRGVMSRLISTRGIFSDAPWPTFHSGVTPAYHAFYNHLVVRRGSVEIDRVDAHHCRYLPFWSHLKGTDLSVVAIDVPKTFPVEGIKGVQICGWGEHYPLLRTPASYPAHVIDEVIEKFGRYPHPREITTPRSLAQQRNIYQTLSSSHELIRGAIEHYLDAEPYDLFLGVLSPAHYAGHQFYHLMEPTHWDHKPDYPDDLKQALLNIYVQTDATIGSILQKVDDSVTVFVMSVHGLATNYAANHLMPQVLQKLGYSVPPVHVKPTGLLPKLLHATQRARTMLPKSLRDWINVHLVSEATHDRAYSAQFASSVDWSKTRAVMTPSDHFEALLSVNLKGREPMGIVEPGKEYDAVCEQLRADMLELKNAATHRPAVSEVVRADEVFDGPNVRHLPDVIVKWAEDAPIDGLAHPKFGEIVEPRYELRQTKHAEEGFVIAAGARINPSAALEQPSTLDFAPTVLSMLGQAVPDYMEGRVWSELLVDAACPAQ